MTQVTMASSLKQCCSNFCTNLIRKKGVAEDMRRTDLVKNLRLYDLTFLSIGGMIGSGLYVLTGTVVKTVAGPSTVLSYVLAAVASGLSALCYAEFAARVPVAGSAYQFTYISVGEFWAFLIGWNVALEHAVSVSAVARAWSGYLDSMFGYPIRNYLLECCKMPGGLIATYPDFLAVGVVVILTILVASGVKLTSKINMAFVVVNLAVILFIFCTGLYLGKIDYWLKAKGGFFPFGFLGTFSGAATLIFAYVGYEVVASATEEAVNPQRDVPLSLLISLAVVVFCYVSASAVLTLLVPWESVSISSPFPTAYAQHGWNWARYIVSVGAMAAMTAAMTTAMLVVPRYLFSMARDGLIMEFFATVNSKTEVPVIGTVISGAFCVVMTAVFNLRTLVEFIAIGQLLACTFVSFCVIKLRYSPNVVSAYYAAQHEDDRNTCAKPAPKDSALYSNGEQTQEDKNDEEETALQCEVPGTIKKSVLYSRMGSAFEWTQQFQPGDLPFYSLLIAVLCSTVVSVLLLFGIKFVTQAWFIILLTMFIAGAAICLAFLTAFRQDELLRTFKVPLVPLIPFISIVVNIVLILNLQPLTWIRLAIWVAIGLVIYFGYGYRHSKVRITEAQRSSSQLQMDEVLER